MEKGVRGLLRGVWGEKKGERGKRKEGGVLRHKRHVT